MAIEIDWRADRYRHHLNLFIEQSLCQKIDDNEEYRRQCVKYHMWCSVNAPKYSEPHPTKGCGLLPSDEFMQYLHDCDIVWSIESVWHDGCSIYISSNFKEALMYLKLRYPELVERYQEANKFTYKNIMQA